MGNTPESIQCDVMVVTSTPAVIKFFTDNGCSDLGGGCCRIGRSLRLSVFLGLLDRFLVQLRRQPANRRPRNIEMASKILFAGNVNEARIDLSAKK